MRVHCMKSPALGEIPLVKAVHVHLLEAGALDPRRPVRRHLRRHRALRLLLEGLVPVLISGTLRKEHETGQPGSEVEVVLARGGTAEEGTVLRQRGRELVVDVSSECRPMLHGLRKEALLDGVGHLALEDGKDTAVAGLLLVVEGLEGCGLGELAVLLERLLACGTREIM